MKNSLNQRFGKYRLTAQGLEIAQQRSEKHKRFTETIKNDDIPIRALALAVHEGENKCSSC